MDKLTDVFKDKLDEYEFKSYAFETTERHSEVVDKMVDELRRNSRRLRNIDLQAKKLYERLQNLQKNYYDTMETVDSEEATNPRRNFHPWHSKTEYTRSKYAWWNVEPRYFAIEPPYLVEVAIRKEGHEKEVQALDGICKRINVLNEAAEKLTERNDELKNELNKYGVWNVVKSFPDIEF